jgi:hypothetical protein
MNFQFFYPSPFITVIKNVTRKQVIIEGVLDTNLKTGKLNIHGAERENF